MPSSGDVLLSSYPQGRVLVFQDGLWGTLCGTYWADNDHGANNICQQLGYAGGTRYDAPGGMGAIVAGWRTCAGTERTVFDCPPAGNANDYDTRRRRYQYNRIDETMACTHEQDQGVQCVGDRTNTGLLCTAPASYGISPVTLTAAGTYVSGGRASTTEGSYSCLQGL